MNDLRGTDRLRSLACVTLPDHARPTPQFVTGTQALFPSPDALDQRRQANRRRNGVEYRPERKRQAVDGTAYIDCRQRLSRGWEALPHAGCRRQERAQRLLNDENHFGAAPSASPDNAQIESRPPTPRPTRLGWSFHQSFQSQATRARDHPNAWWFRNPPARLAPFPTGLEISRPQPVRAAAHSVVALVGSIDKI